MNIDIKLHATPSNSAAHGDDTVANCTKYNGARVRGRVTGEVSTFEAPTNADPASQGWRRHPRLDWVWTHKDFPEHQLHELGDDCWATVHRARRKPKPGAAVRAAQHALGPAVQLTDTVLFSPVLRLPLVAPPSLGEQFDKPTRCAGAESITVVIDGVVVELRLTISVRTPGEPTIAAEAFIGARHVRADGTLRSFFYTSDVRRIPRKAHEKQMVLLAKVIDALFAFAVGFEKYGFTIDVDAKVAMPVIAVANRIRGTDVVAFDIRPQFARVDRFLTYGGAEPSIVRVANGREVEEHLRRLEAGLPMAA